MDVKLFGQASDTIKGISSVVGTHPAELLIITFSARSTLCLKLVKTPTSRGCSTWVVWAGKHRWWMSFFQATSISSEEIWLEWPSCIHNTGSRRSLLDKRFKPF